MFGFIKLCWASDVLGSPSVVGCPKMVFEMYDTQTPISTLNARSTLARSHTHTHTQYCTVAVISKYDTSSCIQFTDLSHPRRDLVQ